MLHIRSYVWLLLLAICCWHCMAAPKKDNSAHSHEHASKEHASHEHASKEHASHEHASHEHASHEHASHEHASHEHASHEHASHEHASSKEKKPHCTNGKQDKDETDIDCGGKKCEKCADKKVCKVDSDCMSGFCEKKKCAQQATKPTKTSTAKTEGTTASSTSSTSPKIVPTTVIEITTTETPETEATTTAAPEITATTSPSCDFECQNGGTCIDHNQCACTTGFSGPTCEVQSVGLCLDGETFDTEPLLLITFGSGSPQYSSATPASFNFSTTYQQRFAPQTNDGMFSFINSVHDDFNGVWHTGATDHSEDDNGYMYLVNADFKAGQFYKGTVNDLCVGLRYEFSVYLANVLKPLNKIKPNVRFEVRSVVDDTLLAQLESGDIAEHNTLTWEKYGFSFIATNPSVNLLMISNAPGGSGNDIVIDDIALRVCSNGGSGFCPSN